MQKIKFRCWDKNKKQMRAVRELCFDQYGTIDVYCECDDINEPAKGNDSLMQFTGLLDRNGKEIYEGDIVRIGDEKSEHIEVIKWVDETNWMDEKCPVNGWVNHQSIYKMPIEVIGNVNENPELLNK